MKKLKKLRHIVCVIALTISVVALNGCGNLAENSSNGMSSAERSALSKISGRPMSIGSKSK